MEQFAFDRYAAMRAVLMMPDSWLRSSMEDYLQLATEQLLHNLIGELSTTLLVNMGLELKQAKFLNGQRVIYIQTAGNRKWQPPPNNLRHFVVPAVPMHRYASLTAEMLPLALLPLQVSDDPIYIGHPFASASIATTVLVYNNSPPSSSLLPQPPSPEQQQQEIVSVTVPANFPNCAHEVMLSSPTTGQMFRFTIPLGSQPGSQLLIRMSGAR